QHFVFWILDHFVDCWNQKGSSFSSSGIGNAQGVTTFQNVIDDLILNWSWFGVAEFGNILFEDWLECKVGICSLDFNYYRSTWSHLLSFLDKSSNIDYWFVSTKTSASTASASTKSSTKT